MVELHGGPDGAEFDRVGRPVIPCPIQVHPDHDVGADSRGFLEQAAKGEDSSLVQCLGDAHDLSAADIAPEVAPPDVVDRTSHDL